jgi:hypothetical protein
MRVGLTATRLDGPKITVETRGLAAHDHPELRLVVREDLVPPPQLAWLADRLAAPVFEAGERWADRETIRAGWTELRFRAGAGGLLDVEAWDFAGATWVDDATALLLPLGLMNDVLDRVGANEGARYPWGGQTAAWAVEDPRGIVLAAREEPEEGDSGWRFTTDRPVRARVRPLWEIAADAPGLVGILALPPGSRVEAFGGQTSHIEVSTPSTRFSTS